MMLTMMMTKETEKHMELIEQLFIKNGEYKFDKKEDRDIFKQTVLRKAEQAYREEGYNHKYEEFEDFLHTHHVDAIAYWTSCDEYC